jgi:hypothetical protein
VIHSAQVVVYGFGRAHYANIVNALAAGVGDKLLHCIHRVVTAYIYKPTYVVPAKGIKNILVNFRVYVGRVQFYPARPQGRRGGVYQLLNHIGVG